MTSYGKRLPGRPELQAEEEALGTTVTHTNIKMHNIFGTGTLMHTVPLVFFSKRWLLLLGSWQFVLSKWYLPVPLPCPSLDVVQCRRSQTELSLRGIRGKKNGEASPG